MVSPRKSRRKSACFSSTTTSTPARASRKPSVSPHGPPPTMQQRVEICSAAIDALSSPAQAIVSPLGRRLVERDHGEIIWLCSSRGLFPLPAAAGRGWREAPGEGQLLEPTAYKDAPHPLTLPAKAG